MICDPCGRGGDLAKTIPPQRNGADITASNRHNGLKRRVANLHGRCKGESWCDCQHAGTKHDRTARHLTEVTR